MRQNIPLKTIKAVIERDKCICQNCGKVGVFVMRYGKPAVVEPLNGLTLSPGQDYNGRDCLKFELHHRRPYIVGGDNSIDNLELTCRKCNRSMGLLAYLRELEGC